MRSSDSPGDAGIATMPFAVGFSRVCGAVRIRRVLSDSISLSQSFSTISSPVSSKFWSNDFVTIREIPTWHPPESRVLLRIPGLRQCWWIHFQSADLQHIGIFARRGAGKGDDRPAVVLG